MKIAVLASLVASYASSHITSFVVPQLEPLSLVQLGLEDKPMAPSALRLKAKAKFMALMHEAEVHAEHDPAVLKADKVLNDAEAKFKTDSHKASNLLTSIKTRLAKSRADTAKQEKNASIEAVEIKKFTERENAKLEATEKKLMALQQQKISSSFAQLPAMVESSFVQMVKGHDGSKAQQEIHAAQKALSALSAKIKTRVENLTQMLGTPGKQFPGEIVL